MFLTVIVIRHWNKLPKEAVDTLLPEALKSRLDAFPKDRLQSYTG